MAMKTNGDLKQAGRILRGSLRVIVTVLIVAGWPHEPKAEGTNTHKYELLLDNRANNAPVVVTVEPVGWIFNDSLVYSLTTSQGHQQPGEPITGVTVTIAPGVSLGYVADHANSSTPDSTHRHIGYGKYKVTVGLWGHIYVDFTDADYGYPSFPGDSRTNDIILKYDGDTLLWGETPGPGGAEFTLTPGDTIEVWDQTRLNLGSGPQNKDGFKILAGTTVPLDGSDAVVTHIDPQRLFVNAEVLGNITVTRDCIVQGATLKLQHPGTTVSFSPG
ncbi:hypothetical protein D6833_09210, partial [Candidatus Parcubacteria bacterium]